MATSTTVNTVLLETQRIAETWKSNPQFTLGDLTHDRLMELRTQVQSLSEAIESRRLELQGMINQRDDLMAELKSVATRVRSGVKAYFGPNSTQYEQVGGTRSSERKATVRKSANPAAVAKT